VKTQPLLSSEFMTLDFSVGKNSNVSFVFSDASSEQMVDRDRCLGHSPQETIDRSSSSLIVMLLVESNWTELLIRSEQPGSSAMDKE